MKEITKRNISIIFIVILFGATIIIFFLLTWPALTKIFDLNYNLNQIKNEYEKQNRAVQLAKSIIEQYKNLNDVNQMISLTMPRTEELYNVLVQLNKISENSGLIIQNLSLQKSTPTSISTSTNQQELIKSMQTIIITLSLNGTYESFKTWLEAIETNIRLMDITSITFASLTYGEKSGGANFFNFKVNLNLYYQP